MKTSIKTLAIALTAIVLSASVSSTFAADPKKAKTAKMRTVAAPSGVKRIIASGNVELVLVQDGAEGVSYLNEGGSAEIIQRGDQLRISANTKETQQLRVSVKDLYRIEASDAVKIRTVAGLDLKYLQIVLKDQSAADIKANVQGLYTLLADGADLTLSGSADEHTLQMGKVSRLTMDQFSTKQATVNTAAEQVASL